MRICFLNHNLDEQTGAGRFLGSLLRAFGRIAPEIESVVMTARPSGAPGELAILPAGRAGIIRALPRIRRVCYGGDIIHALDGYPYGVMAALANLGRTKPIVITAIGTGALQPLGRPMAGRLLRWAYRNANRVVAVSAYTARELQRRVPDLRITAVINHGVDMSRFAGELPLSESEEGEIKKLRPYILSVGALKPRKGYHYSLEAFAVARPAFPNLRYVIVGRGDREDLSRDIRRLNLSDSVRHYPAVEQRFLVALYRNAELFILLPYEADGDTEGFGLVFLEAAACGLPVIGALGSGAEDAIAEDRNGFLVPPRDSASAAKSILRLLGDAALSKRLADGSVAFSRQMSWDRAARSYREVYSKILGSAGPLGASGSQAI